MPKIPWCIPGLAVAVVLSLLVYVVLWPRAEPGGGSQPDGSGTSTATSGYPVHHDITATVFWVGEPAGPDNDYIPNADSAWDSHWQEHFGGVDEPDDRQRDGQWPAGFTPLENPYYCALPVSDYDDYGQLRPEVDKIYWHDPAVPTDPGRSWLKNRWVAISLGDTTVYAQWQDVGPFVETDFGYVFGDEPPTDKRAGIDLSPATAARLGMNRGGRLSQARAQVSWWFVDIKDVPPGPWLDTVTTSQISR